MSERECFVYLICHVRDGVLRSPIKLGVSHNPFSRLRTIQTSNPYPLEIGYAFRVPNREIALMIEGAFHSVKHDSSLTGEWFEMKPIEALAAMCQNFRAYFQHQMGDAPEDEREEWLWWTGVPQAERMIEAIARAPGEPELRVS